MIGPKNYKDMSRSELAAEARKKKLDPRLLTFKGTERALARDRIEIIRRLNELDQQRRSEKAILIALIALATSIISLLK